MFAKTTTIRSKTQAFKSCRIVNFMLNKPGWACILCVKLQVKKSALKLTIITNWTTKMVMKMISHRVATWQIQQRRREARGRLFAISTTSVRATTLSQTELPGTNPRITSPRQSTPRERTCPSHPSVHTWPAGTVPAAKDVRRAGEVAAHVHMASSGLVGGVK